MPLKQNNCKKHWSTHGGKCHKCQYLATYYQRNRHKLQAGGSSGAALVGNIVDPFKPRTYPTPIQR